MYRVTVTKQKANSFFCDNYCYRYRSLSSNIQFVYPVSNGEQI